MARIVHFKVSYKTDDGTSIAEENYDERFSIPSVGQELVKPIENSPRFIIGIVEDVKRNDFNEEPSLITIFLQKRKIITFPSPPG